MSCLCALLYRRYKYTFLGITVNSIWFQHGFEFSHYTVNILIRWTEGFIFRQYPNVFRILITTRFTKCLYWCSLYKQYGSFVRTSRKSSYDWWPPLLCALFFGLILVKYRCTFCNFHRSNWGSRSTSWCISYLQTTRLHASRTHTSIFVDKIHELLKTTSRSSLIS